MEINKIPTREKVINPEGSIVYNRTPEIQLYLEASNLKIKSDAFYQTADEKLKSVIDQANKLDIEYVSGLAKYLASNGLKLSPVVLASVLSSRKMSFRDKGFEFIFNTPERIAEAVALGKSMHLNNSFKKNVLKVSLEKMGEFTLRKNRMMNRKIKLRDLIKLLRPKPKDENMAMLYKAIIENTKEAKLKSTETLVSIKSDKEISMEDKKKFIVESLDKIPINQLIRNLKFIDENFSFTEGNKLKERIIDKLNNIKDFRFLNIFDLIEVAVNVPGFEKPMFEVTKRYIENFKKDLNIDFKDSIVLFDFSGSMAGEPKNVGFKYLVLFSLLFDNLKMYGFANNLWEINGRNDVIKLIKTGQLTKAKEVIDRQPGGGTALLDSINKVLILNPELTDLVTISDEVSWAEGEDLTGLIGQMRTRLSNKKIYLINPSVYKGTVFSGNVLGVSSLTSSILTDVLILRNPQEFIQYVRCFRR